MTREDYVSYEVAKLLKEKGFNEEVLAVYIYDNLFIKGENEIVNTANVPIIPAPTHQIAMRWLREKHNLFIFPFPQRNTNKFWTEIFQLSDNQEWENLYCESIDLQDYPTYEDACEAAIKYSLENLILL